MHQTFFLKSDATLSRIPKKASLLCAKERYSAHCTSTRIDRIAIKSTFIIRINFIPLLFLISIKNIEEKEEHEDFYKWRKEMGNFQTTQMLHRKEKEEHLPQ